MRILIPIVQILLLEVFDAPHHFSCRRTVAPQLVCDDHPRDIAQGFSSLREVLGRFLITGNEQGEFNQDLKS